MAQGQISLKRVGVDKANARIVMVSAGAAFLSVFFIVSSIALFSQIRYQNKVIGDKKAAVKQLEDNLKARDELVDKYKAFDAAPQNILQGNPQGTGPLDGSNAKLVLDSLPSKYDFPALTSSIEKMVGEHHTAIQTLAGSDDEVNQSTPQVDGKPQTVEIPFAVSVKGDYNGIKDTTQAFYSSIRPIQVDKLHFSGDGNDLAADITARTYYQPETVINFTSKVVK